MLEKIQGGGPWGLIPPLRFVRPPFSWPLPRAGFPMLAPSKYSGLISFRMDWFDILAVQGALKSLPQHRSLKASILQHSAFFMIQLSHSYKTMGETMSWITHCTPSRRHLLFWPELSLLCLLHIWWCASLTVGSACFKLLFFFSLLLSYLQCQVKNILWLSSWSWKYVKFCAGWHHGLK